ncbi:MAG: hypothetical protein FJW36_04275 [Acidobacteria bacterium]|nr:hypothetical protein [Acidobacteriota bacterium]
MFYVFVFIWAFAIVAGITMVWLLAWAIRQGEFKNLRAGARSIFDENEPEGKVTDYFPGEAPLMRQLEVRR